jgi:MarR family transcriptional repressor of emrRAB
MPAPSFNSLRRRSTSRLRPLPPNCEQHRRSRPRKIFKGRVQELVKRSQIDNLLGALALTTKDNLTSDFRGLDLHSETDVATLVLLLQFEGLSIRGLAELLELSHSSTVRVADRLENRSLVRRSYRSEDARGVQLTLTNTGRSLASAALAARGRTLRSMLSVLSTAELRQFGDLLTKVLVGVTTSRMAADRLCRLCNEAACTRTTCPVEQRALQVVRQRSK